MVPFRHQPCRESRIILRVSPIEHARPERAVIVKRPGTGNIIICRHDHVPLVGALWASDQPNSGQGLEAS